MQCPTVRHSRVLNPGHSCWEATAQTITALFTLEPAQSLESHVDIVHFQQNKGYLEFVLLHFCVLFRRHVYVLTFMSEGEVEGGFPAQQEKPKPAPKHNHKTTS